MHPFITNTIHYESCKKIFLQSVWYLVLNNRAFKQTHKQTLYEYRYLQEGHEIAENRFRKYKM